MSPEWMWKGGAVLQGALESGKKIQLNLSTSWISLGYNSRLLHLLSSKQVLILHPKCLPICLSLLAASDAVLAQVVVGLPELLPEPLN